MGSPIYWRPYLYWKLNKIKIYNKINYKECKTKKVISTENHAKNIRIDKIKMKDYMKIIQINYKECKMIVTKLC